MRCPSSPLSALSALSLIATSAVADLAEVGEVWTGVGQTICGTDLALPCPDGACAPGHVLYKTTGLCSACGIDGAFCCPSEIDVQSNGTDASNAAEIDFVCITGAQCTIGIDPLATLDPLAPYGLARVCAKADVVDQTGSGGVPPTARAVDKRTGLAQWRSSRSPRLRAASQWKYQLDTMLGLSFAFYEIQRAGRLPPNTRLPWRGDSLKTASGTGSLDGEFQGGYFDAGDFNKFMLPMAYSTARLSWTVQRFPKVLKRTWFDGSRNYWWAGQAAKWGADFMYKAVVSPDRMLLHIGDIRADHGYIGRSEEYPQINRNIQFCSTGQCSDVAGEVAATLAHSAAAFRNRDILSKKYWERAKWAYRQTGVSDMKFGNSNDVFSDLAIYYASSGVVSHVFFAAASMYDACSALSYCGGSEAEGYMRDALTLATTKEDGGGQKWFWEVPSWDNAWWDAAVIMASRGHEGPQIYGQPAFKGYLGTFADKWINGKDPVQVSPAGQRWVSAWGSNRYSLAGASVLLLWADLPDEMRSGPVTRQQARCAAVKQIHVVAGDNPRGSYVVGYGANFPKRNHHRNSACSPAEQRRLGGTCSRLFFDVANPRGDCPVFEDQKKGICYKSANRDNAFQTEGALVGGPKTASDAGPEDKVPYSYEGFSDWRTDWVGSEQTLDYNVGYTMALAAAMALPGSFWSGNCGEIDLQMDRKAGLSRRVQSDKDAPLYRWADFEEYGWTRTLPQDWYWRVPELV